MATDKKVIEAFVPPPSQRAFRYSPPSLPLDYVHADDHILVLNKPYGLLTTPGRPDHHKDSLELRVQADYPGAKAIHRLDHSTSGLVIFARTPAVQAKVTQQFEARTVKKTYLARVWGHVAADEGAVDVPLRKNWLDTPRQIICYERGKSAVTRWKLISRNEDGSSLLKLFPETGRTHQLRMHMLHIQHPILGDELYAPDLAYHAAPRLQLHASEISFEHPHTFVPICFSVGVEFDRGEDVLRKKNTP